MNRHITTYLFTFLTLCFILPVTAKDIQKETIEVLGNCGMCESRITQAALGKGVKSAVWDKNTKQLQIIYDADKTSMEEIEKRIAEAGHDTPNFRADDETYERLHGCCMYPRKE